MRRRPNTQVVQWFLELDARGQLNLDPPFQRRSVWSDGYRRYFIETVLRDLPSPAIYLQVEQRPDQPTLYHVIDGKQRLEALLSFAKDGYSLGDRLKDEGLGGKYFSELPEDRRVAFAEYVLNVENISSASSTELVDAFDRLNRNVARLSSQELRHAQFAGRFATKMLDLAEHPFWADIGMSTRARIRRMADVEFVSELYVLTMRGVQDGRDEILDSAYADYDEEIPEEEEHDARFQRVLDFLRDLDLPWKSSRWKNQADFYGLWAAVLEEQQARIPLNPQTASVMLQALGAALSNPEAAATPQERRYSDAVRQGSNKDTNRRLRTDIIRELITDNPDDPPSP